MLQHEICPTETYGFALVEGGSAIFVAWRHAPFTWLTTNPCVFCVAVPLSTYVPIATQFPADEQDAPRTCALCDVEAAPVGKMTALAFAQFPLD